MDFAFFRDLPEKAFLVAWIWWAGCFRSAKKETAAGGPLFQRWIYASAAPAVKLTLVEKLKQLQWLGD
jgi:hypothetical protein